MFNRKFTEGYKQRFVQTMSALTISNRLQSALGGNTYMCILLRAYATYRPGGQCTRNDTANKGML